MKADVWRSIVDARCIARWYFAMQSPQGIPLSIEGIHRCDLAPEIEIIIANAYFLPGVQLQRALLRAARRGVRITLLLQGQVMSTSAQYHGSRAVYRVMLDAGITIIEYEASFLHAKVAVMDAEGGALATVGSSNLDPLSPSRRTFHPNDFPKLIHLYASHKGPCRTRWYTRRPLVARGLNRVAYALMRALLSSANLLHHERAAARPAIRASEGWWMYIMCPASK